MKPSPKRNWNCYWLSIFFWLSSLELLFAAILSLIVRSEAKNAFLFGFSKTRLALVTFLFIAAILAGVLGISALKKQIHDRILRWMSDRPWKQVVPALLVLVIGLGVISLDVSLAALTRLAPTLLCFWLIGAQYTILSSRFSNEERQSILEFPPTGELAHRKLIATVAVILIYASLLIPVGISNPLDGIPLDTPSEFIIAAVLIPLALLIDWRYFAKYLVVEIVTAILVIRILLGVVTPLSGLMIWVYQNGNPAENDLWRPGYETIVHPGISARMTAPYENIRQFPVEWINDKKVRVDQVTFQLRVLGYAHIAENQALAFVAQGLEHGTIELIDLDTGKFVSALLLDGSQPVENKYLSDFPTFQRLRIQGTLTFAGAQPYQFFPVILSGDGSIHNAFEQGTLWCQPQGTELSPIKFRFLQFLQNLTGITLFAIVLLGILTGLWRLYRQKTIQPIDLYLVASSVFGSTFLAFLDKPAMERIIPFAILGFGLIRLLTLWATREAKLFRTSSVSMLLSVGVATLILFLFLDIHGLREIFVFPQGQDSLSYQIMARSIFLEDDFLLTHSRIPPHAYKLLFPYLAGILHIVFGQSSAALFFLNAWCGVLIAFLVNRVLERQGIPWVFSFGASLLLLFVLTQPSFFVFFFRFGLIEPIATLGLTLVIYYLSTLRFAPALFAGIPTVLFRLDYLGGVLAALILTANPVTGSLKQTWQSVAEFARTKWKMAILYGAILLTLPLAAILFYRKVYPNYVLNARDTVQYSAFSILEGLLRIVIGGSLPELTERFQQNPLDAVIITGILASGTLIGVMTLLWRRGKLKYIDMRWGILLLGLLSAYIPVKPTGYSPRFSTPLLPLAVIQIAIFLYEMKMNKARNGTRCF